MSLKNTDSWPMFTHREPTELKLPIGIELFVDSRPTGFKECVAEHRDEFLSPCYGFGAELELLGVVLEGVYR